MAKEAINNVKLGLFISSGLAVLIISLYLIGKNQSFFGSYFHARARFKNINGLMTGNNVRFAGIQAGTVSKIQVINDTTIEVELLIDKKMKPFIHANAFAAIGNDGLMGNKVINLTPNAIPAKEVEEGALLAIKRSPETDDMMQTFSNTNQNVLAISQSLINTLNRLNESKAFWNILNDTSIPFNLSQSMVNIKASTIRINELSLSLNSLVKDLHDGKGAAGLLLEDKATANNVRSAIENLTTASKESLNAISKIDSLVAQVQQDAAHGHGTVHTLLRDSVMANRLSNSMLNIEKGTAAFNQDMEALQHNFLTRKYFKKQEKLKKAGQK